MTKRKPKAFRARLYPDDMGGHCAYVNYSLKAHDCTVYPDGAALPRDRRIYQLLRRLHGQTRNNHKARKLPHADWLEIGRILGGDK